MLIEPLLCFITLWNNNVTLEFIVETHDGIILAAFDQYDDSKNTITISNVCLEFLCKRLKATKDEVSGVFQSLELPEYCCITSCNGIYEVCVKSKNIDTIFEVIELIGRWWYDNINKIKPIEFPYSVLANTIIVCNEIVLRSEDF